MQLGVRRQARLLDLGQLQFEHQPQFGIFIADIDVSVLGLDRPGGDQHTFDKAVGIAPEIKAVLEGARLALVGVDREHAGRGLGAHQRPFAAGRETGAAEAAQVGVADDPDQFLARALVGKTRLEQRIAAGLLIGDEIGIGREGMRMRLGRDRGGDRAGRCVEGLHMADGGHRRAVAGAHARRAHHADRLAVFGLQIGQQLFATGHGAGQRIADPHGDFRRRQLAFLHDVEMSVEGRDFIDLGERHLHFEGERGQMRGGEMPVVVLDEMQMLDQQVPPARAVGQKRAHFVERGRIDLAPFRRARRAAPAGTGNVRGGRPLLQGRAHNILQNTKRPRKTAQNKSHRPIIR